MSKSQFKELACTFLETNEAEIFDGIKRLHKKTSQKAINN